MGSRKQKLVSAILSIFILANGPAGARGQPNCNTALSRIAHAAAEKAISEHRNTACSGLKQGSIRIDKTKRLDLLSFKVCEAGSVVSADISVRIRCGTSDAAVVKVDIEEDASATAAADLDTCTVLSASVSAKGFIAKAGLSIADVDAKVRAAVEKEIKPYCKK